MKTKLTLKEAIELCIKGEVVQCEHLYLRIKDGRFQVNSTINDIDYGWISSFSAEIDKQQWYVVEPPNPIEAEIEAMFKSIPFAMYSKETSIWNSSMRRIANFALEQAIAAMDKDFGKLNIQSRNKLEALKVKE